MFLYFIPDATSRNQVTNLAAARSVGLGYAFEFDRQVGKRRIQQGGPGDAGGQLVYDQLLVKADRATIDLAAQRWRKMTPIIEGTTPPPAIWIGYWLDATPRLVDYARTDQLAGQHVQLDDGQTIIAAQARQMCLDEPTLILYERLTLPRGLDFDDDGETLLGDVNARYRLLWDLACKHQDAVADAVAEAGGESEVVSFRFPEIHHLVDLAIKTQYRFGVQELCTLGLYSTQLRDRVIDVLLDLDGFLRLQKKMRDLLAARESGGSSAGPGPSKPDAGTEPATLPPSPIGSVSPPECIETPPSM